jgi:hypothetical protein
VRNGCRLRTIALYELERAGYKISHTTEPLRWTVDGLAEDITSEQLVDLAEEHGVPLMFPLFVGVDFAAGA